MQEKGIKDPDAGLCQVSWLVLQWTTKMKDLHRLKYYELWKEHEVRRGINCLLGLKFAYSNNSLVISYLPLMDWQQICEKEGAYNLEICEHNPVSCTELPIFAGRKE